MNVLVTGGLGRLGRELEKILPGTYLDLPDLDITDKNSISNVLNKYTPDICLHLAAETDLVKCEKDKEHAFKTNVTGTSNIVSQCIEKNINLVYPSTDYIFDGETGNYNESDYPNPINYYALTKLLGEYEVKRVQNHLILRGTMKPRDKWKHPVAPVDMFESLLHHDEFAKIMAALITQKETGLFHLGKGKFSVYEWASKFDDNVKSAKLEEINFPLPKDISLDCSKLNQTINMNELFGGD